MRTVELGPGAWAAISDRHGGTSSPPYDSLNLSLTVGDDPERVAANRHRAAAALGFEPAGVVWMEQVHGSTVAVVEEVSDRPVGGVDGLVTRRRRLVLAVLVADCVPVLLADGAAGVLGVAHAGRRGLAAGVVQATVAAISGLGADPANVTALVGPAVCPGCYEVPAAMQRRVVERVPETEAQSSRRTPALDLPAGVLAVLGRAGVRRSSRWPVCTAEDPAAFSHRRDGVTGRFAGFAWLS